MMRRTSLGSGALGSSPALHPACWVTWGDLLLPLDPNCSLCETEMVVDGPISVVES